MMEASWDNFKEGLRDGWKGFTWAELGGNDGRSPRIELNTVGSIHLVKERIGHRHAHESQISRTLLSFLQPSVYLLTL